MTRRVEGVGQCGRHDHPGIVVAGVEISFGCDGELVYADVGAVAHGNQRADAGVVLQPAAEGVLQKTVGGIFFKGDKSGHCCDRRAYLCLGCAAQAVGRIARKLRAFRRMGVRKGEHRHSDLPAAAGEHGNRFDERPDAWAGQRAGYGEAVDHVENAQCGGSRRKAAERQVRLCHLRRGSVAEPAVGLLQQYIVRNNCHRNSSRRAAAQERRMPQK